jgi:hypothetical protein
MVLALKILVPIRGCHRYPDSGVSHSAMQDQAGRKGGRAYAKLSKISAIAAGKACTSRILRLTVTAP